MAEVKLNGETVNFEGSPPSSPSQVWSVVESFLGQSGLLIDRFLIDGKAWSPDVSESGEDYRVIEIFSITQEQNVGNIARSLLDGRERLLERWERGACESLSQPWAQFQGEGVEILNETESLAQAIGLLSEYSNQCQLPWAQAVRESGEKFNEALSSVMDAIESGDCIAYSDIAATNVRASITGFYQVLAEQVLPSSREDESR